MYREGNYGMGYWKVNNIWAKLTYSCLCPVHPVLIVKNQTPGNLTQPQTEVKSTCEKARERKRVIKK